MTSFSAYVAMGMLVVGCSAKALNVGANEEPIDLNSPACQDASAQITLPDWTAPDACVIGDEIASLVGVWEGYYQGTAIGDEQSTFRITIMGANAQKGLCGTISFGTHTAAVAFPPPSTDPTVIYPPEGMYPQVDVWRGSVSTILGLPYTIVDGKIDGQRVTFNYSLFEIFKSWCELQTPYPMDPACYHFSCAPNVSATFNADHACQLIATPTAQPGNTTCAQFVMCNGPMPFCECNADRCTAATNTAHSFDLVFNNGQASGVADGRNVLLQLVSTTTN